MTRTGRNAHDIATIGNKIGEIDVTIGPRFLNLFSEHLYSSPNKAFEELVSNSWDAGAETVHISVPSDLENPAAAVWVLDNGESMDIQGLQDLWSVATSKKRLSKPRNGRKQIGKFGVGKLATYLLANQLTYICKASDGKIRAVTMDYRHIDKAAQNALHIEKIPLAVRELTETELNSLLEPHPLAAKLIGKGIPKLKKAGDYEDEFGSQDEPPSVPKGTWTIAILSSLKEEGRRLQHGWIKRILRTALPLGGSISISFNGEALYSSKSTIPIQEEWILGPDLDFDSITLPDETVLDIKRNQRPYPHIEIEGLGVITGRARLFESKISGGKSEGIGLSNGFFVNVLGRVIKPDDPYFGLANLSFSAWSKFRATIRADGLDSKLSVTREGISESRELEIVQALLMKLFNKARTAHDDATEAAWPNAGEILVEKWGTVPFEPLRRVVADRLTNSPPGFLDVSKITDVGRAKEEWEEQTSSQPESLITSVVIEEASSSDPLVKYEVATRRVVVNQNHPFTLEHGSSQEQLRLLRDAALVDLLTEAFMADVGVPDEQIREILNYRDRAYRLVAQVRRHSAAQIATMLMETTDHAKGLERIVGDALENIGFAVQRLGQSGEPEGVATAVISAAKGEAGADTKVIYKFTYDAKSSLSGKASTHNVGVSALARHREDHHAKYALVVAPDFADGALQTECEAANVTPIRAKDLARLVMLAAGYGALNLNYFQGIFKNHSPDSTSIWIDDLTENMKRATQLSLDTLVKALKEITEANPERPDMLDCSLIAEQCRKITGSNSFPSRNVVSGVIRGLSLVIPNIIQVSNTGYDVILSAPATKIKEALARQLNNVPDDMKFGINRNL